MLHVSFGHQSALVANDVPDFISLDLEDPLGLDRSVSNRERGEFQGLVALNCLQLFGHSLAPACFMFHLSKRHGLINVVKKRSSSSILGTHQGGVVGPMID
jgi:hypothetical protein